MPYLGRQPLQGRYQDIDDISSSFNGSLTIFDLKAGGSPVNAFVPQSLIVSLGGVIQKPGTDFTVAGSKITFTTAPTSGTTFFAYLLGDTLNVGGVSDGAITARSLADGSIPGSKFVQTTLLMTSANTTFSNNVTFANNAGTYTKPVVDFTNANVVGLSTGSGGGAAGAISGVTVINETANGDLNFTFHNSNTTLNITDEYIQTFFSASSNTTINANGFLVVTL